MRVLSDGGERRSNIPASLNIFFPLTQLIPFQVKYAWIPGRQGVVLQDECYLQLAGPDAIKLDH